MPFLVRTFLSLSTATEQPAFLFQFAGRRVPFRDRKYRHFFLLPSASSCVKAPKSHTNPFKITPWCVNTPKSHTNPAFGRELPRAGLVSQVFDLLARTLPSLSSSSLRSNSLPTDTSPLPVAAGGHARSRESPLLRRSLGRSSAPKLRTTLRKFPQSSTNFLPNCPPERSLPAKIKQGDCKNPRKRGLPAGLKQEDDTK